LHCEVWRGGRVAEGARLESVFTGNRNVGSNPTLSASFLNSGIYYLISMYYQKTAGTL
jgi:hypothetical protein